MSVRVWVVRRMSQPPKLFAPDRRFMNGETYQQYPKETSSQSCPQHARWHCSYQTCRTAKRHLVSETQSIFIPACRPMLDRSKPLNTTVSDEYYNNIVPAAEISDPKPKRERTQWGHIPWGKSCWCRRSTSKSYRQLRHRRRPTSRSIPFASKERGQSL